MNHSETCQVEGCEDAAVDFGLCYNHYMDYESWKMLMDYDSSVYMVDVWLDRTYEEENI